MKTTTILTCFLFLIFFHNQSFSQFNGAYTYYYNYVSNIVNSNEVGEAAADDAAGNLYVAGERSKETTSQAVHIIKYLPSGIVSISKDHTDSLYKEYVKKVLVSGTNVYILCNAISNTTGKSSLLVLRYNTSLTFLSSSLLSAYNTPTDATLDDSAHIFISCYKATKNSSELEVLKLNNVLAVLHTYEYHYSSVTDTYTENALNLYYNTIDKSVYVAGNVLSSTNLSTALLLKLKSGTDALTWVKTSGFSSGLNSYNSVRTSSTRVYAAGSLTDSSKVTYMHVEAYNYAGNLPLSYSYYDKINKGAKFKNTSALKITLAASFDVYIAGIAKDSSNQKCDMLLCDIIPRDSAVPVIEVEKVSMPYNTTVSDAVTNQQSLYSLITGCKAVGANQNMFAYGYLDGRDVISYRDSIINRSACGNKIVFDNVNQAWITGYLDTKSNAIAPHDYEYFTRRYIDSGIIGFQSAPPVTTNITKNILADKQTTVSPNPAHDNLNIAAKESIKDIQLYNEAGKLVLQQHLQTEDVYQYSLNIRFLSAGFYILRINSEQAFKIIKQ